MNHSKIGVEDFLALFRALRNLSISTSSLIASLLHPFAEHRFVNLAYLDATLACKFPGRYSANRRHAFRTL